MLGCGFYAHTNSLSVRTFTGMRLVDAGMALRPLVNAEMFFLSFFFKSPNSVQSIFFFPRYSAT